MLVSLILMLLISPLPLMYTLLLVRNVVADGEARVVEGCRLLQEQKKAREQARKAAELTKQGIYFCLSWLLACLPNTSSLRDTSTQTRTMHMWRDVWN